MNSKAFRRLLDIQYAQQHVFRPAVRITSRRSAKSQGNGTGLVLKSSRVETQVPLEKHFRPFV